MKKNQKWCIPSISGFVLFFLPLFAISIASCGNLVSKIQIKAAPSIYASLGERKILLDDYLSVEDVKDALGSDSDAEVYDYIHTDGVQRFVIRYPLLETSLDVNEYLDFSDGGTTITPTEFTAPTISDPAPVVISGVTTGIPITQDVLVPITSIVIPTSGFVKATVKTGEIRLTPSNPTSGTVSISHPVILLDNEDLTAGIPFDLPSPITVTLTNAIFSAGAPLKVTTSVVITEFEAVTFTLPDDANLSQTIDVNVSEDTKDLIEKITFDTDAGKSLFDLTVTNGLPLGNNVKVTIDAPDFGLNSQEETFAADVTPKTTTQSYLGTEWTPADNQHILITMTIVDSADAPLLSGGELTLKNIAPGQTYGISGELNTKFDWATVQIKPYTQDPSTTGDPIDLSSLKEQLPENMGFKTVNSSIYVGPESETNKLSGYIFAEYATTESFPMLGNGSSGSATPGALDMKGALPKPLSTNAVITHLPTNTAQAPSNLKTVFNAFPEDLVIAYQIGTGVGFIINRTDLGDDSVLRFAGDIILDIPLTLEKIDPTKEAYKDLDDYTGSGDLLGRNSEGDLGTKDLLDQLVSLTLTVSYNNNLVSVSGANIEALVYTGDVDNPDWSKTILLKPGKNRADIVFSRNEIKTHIIDAYPFVPKIRVIMPDEVSVRRGGGINAVMSITMATDINYTYNLSGGK